MKKRIKVFKRLLLISWVLLHGSQLSADNLQALIARVDSLQTAKSDSLLPVIHCCLSRVETGSPDEKVKVFKMASGYFLRREMMDSAFVYCQLRLDLAREYNKAYDIIMAKTDLGEIYGKKGEFQKAFKYLTEARELSKNTQSAQVHAKIMATQAYLYYLFEKKQESIDLLKMALSLYEEAQDTMNMAYINNNLGIMYKNQARYDSALVFLKQSYIQSTVLQDTLGMASACNNLGNTLSLLMDLKNAVHYLEKSLYYYRAIGREEITLYSNLGRVYSQLNQPARSLQYLTRALELTYEQNEPKKTMGLLQELSDFYREQKNWQMALHYLNEYHQLKELQYRKELPELIDRIQAEADLKVKEQTIALLKEKNSYQALYIRNRNGVIILLILIVIVGAGWGMTFLARKRTESKQRELVMEQRLLRSQMNPHFFFNTLSIIQSFVIQNEAKLAGKYIAKFARLMREILENSAKNKITLQKELTAMENYLSLQQLRLNNNFDYHVQVDQTINPLAIELPPMLFQPFIENAIDHGLNHLTDRKGWLEISITGWNGALKVVIRDNGVGRTKSAELNGSMRKGHQSMGTKITEERLNLLANNKRQRSQLTIRDLTDATDQPAGTEVELIIALG